MGRGKGGQQYYDDDDFDDGHDDWDYADYDVEVSCYRTHAPRAMLSVCRGRVCYHTLLHLHPRLALTGRLTYCGSNVTGGGGSDRSCTQAFTALPTISKCVSACSGLV